MVAENDAFERRRTNNNTPPRSTIVLAILVFILLSHDVIDQEASVFIHHVRRYVRDGSVDDSFQQPQQQQRQEVLLGCNTNNSSTVSTVAQQGHQERIIITKPQHSGDGGFMLTSQYETSKLFQADSFFERLYDAIDSENETQRCQKYGFTYSNRKGRRRIFFGALVADDTRDIISIHAAETYGVYHTVALIESNTTFANAPRNLRFAPSPSSSLYSFITSGIFGSETTNVFVDLWLEDAPGAANMVREAIQRENIMYRWKQEGMRPDDIGIVGDMDEFFSRDFLRAAQVCDVPEFTDPLILHECRVPKVVGLVSNYEASPECRKESNGYHPDMMLGACLAGNIGDASERMVPRRNYKRTRGDRQEGYRADHGGYRKEIVMSGRYPLWTPQDYRRMQGGKQYRFTNDTANDIRTTEWVTGYHVHNFFHDLDTLRHKYTTYGHANSKAGHVALSKINSDLDLVVRCVRGIANKVVAGESLNEKPFTETAGPKPLYFWNETYRRVRHEHVRRIVLEDEKRFGSIYKDEDKKTTKQ